MAEPATKECSTATALMLATGKALGDFAEFHEMAEWVAGHSIWTHEFADSQLWKRLRSEVIAQHPTLGEANADTLTGETAATWLEAELTRIGSPVLAFTKGSGRRTEHPIESMQRLAPGKPIIAV